MVNGSSNLSIFPIKVLGVNYKNKIIMSMLNYLYGTVLMFHTFEEDSTRKKEQARELYWDACKLPRKQKKKVRKQAKSDFELYSILEQPLIF